MITSVRLQNFRSYRDSTYEFDPGVNIIVGPNASGKTNILEAVTVLARGSSFRGRDAEMVSFNKAWARLDGTFDGQDRTIKIQKNSEVYKKTLEVDGKTFGRISSGSTIPLVYFEPNHLTQITRGPAERRAFIDELLELTNPDFKRINSFYRRALAQRNNLLKKGPAAAANQLFAWDVRLGELGSQIAVARQDLTNAINERLAGVYSKIAHKKSTAKAEYLPTFPVLSYASKMVAKLQKTHVLDMARGFSGTGPHREDISFIINGHSIGDAASRGEVRSLLLALKTLELSLVEQARGQKPLLLLDDVFSELDGTRRKALVSTIKNYQSIITTTDAETVLEYFGDQGYKIIALSGRRPPT